MADGRRFASREGEERRRPRLPLAEIGITLAGIALLAALFLAVPELRDSAAAAIRGDHEEVRHEIDSLGVWGPLLILALALIHAVVFYPAEIVDAAAGLRLRLLPGAGAAISAGCSPAMLC